MPRLTVFNNISLDGYFQDAKQGMNWAHQNTNAEWMNFAAENSQGDSRLLFGRVTYDMMVSYWPTEAAHKNMPVVAQKMNDASKVVFSRTMESASWQNTKLIKSDIEDEVRQLKDDSGPDMVVMGSGTIVKQLTDAGLIDSYQLAVHPLALGAGRTLFDGLRKELNLELKETRRFSNGNVVLWYERAD